jgi:two-component system, LytTR family, sensor kinase
MELAWFVTLIQCSAIGSAVSLLLVALLLRQKSFDAGTRIGVLLGVCVFGMYASVCEFTIRRYYAIPISTWMIRQFLLWIIAFLPVLIVWSWRKSPVLRWNSKISSWLVAAAFTSGCGVIAISRWFGPVPEMNQYFLRILALHRALCLVPAILSILRLPLDPRLKTFMKVTCFSYLVASSINAIRAPGLNHASLPENILMLIAQACGLCGLLGSFAVAARFRFVDVFVRWSTRITILGVLTLLGSLSFVLVEIYENPVGRPIGLSLCSLGMVVVVIAGATLTGRCERWVESHVLQRLDLKAESVRLQNELFSIEDTDRLFPFIETTLKELLEIRDVRIVPRSSVPPQLLKLESESNSPLEIDSYKQPLRIGPLEDVDVLVAIPSSNGKREEMIGVSAGAGRRSLNSGEVSFLKDVGHDLGVRLHHLEVEAAQGRLAMRETLLRQQLTEAELRALRAQVNPHFLFNSLNTIADLIARDPTKAERMTLRLSSVFRHVLSRADRQFIALEEEFEFLRNYLDIEQERFGANLQVNLVLCPEVAKFRIPTLLLQPLVENALKHGLAPKRGQRNLGVSAEASADTILIEVVDDGVGFNEASRVTGFAKSRSGVGLANTRARLHAVYGKEGLLRIDSSPLNGCRVLVSIPLKQVQM